MSTYIINSEPECTDPADVDEMLVHDASAYATKRIGLDTLRQYVHSGVVSVGDVAEYTALAANSGKPHIIPDLTADLTIALPAAASGLQFEFIYGGVAADEQDWAIDTGSDTNFYLGGLLYVDDAPAADSAAGNGSSNSIVNVLTPEPGTRVHVVCDGTNWYLSGVVASADAPTFADQA